MQLDQALRLAAPLRAAASGAREVWLVGGTLRDLLLGRDPADIDACATDAGHVAAALASALGRRAVLIGDDPGTWRIASPSGNYDIAPLQGKTIEEDLLRRDYTINAVALDVTQTSPSVIDPTGGVDDASKRILRMVRQSNFDDDPLRVLRGIRLAVALGLELEPRTLAAIKARRRALDDVAPERVQYELSRIVASQGGLRLLRDCGFADLLFGLPLDEAVIEASDRIAQHSSDPVATLALIATMLRIPDADQRLLTRRWTQQTAQRTKRISDAARIAWNAPHDNVLGLQALGESDARLLALILESAGRAAEANRLSGMIDRLDQGWWTQRPLLTGDDLMRDYGLAGPAIGSALRRLLEMQLRGEVTTREEAQRAVTGIINP